MDDELEYYVKITTASATHRVEMRAALTSDIELSDQNVRRKKGRWALRGCSHTRPTLSL